MTAYEYLVEKGGKYSPFPGNIPLVTMGKYTPFKVKGEIYCTGVINYNGIKYGFFVDKNFDGCILLGLPQSVEYQIQCKELKGILRRLNKLFTDMILLAEDSNTNSELVQLRIIVNMMYKLKNIDKYDRTQWVSWVLELFWNRKRLLNQWYIDYVLPF